MAIQVRLTRNIEPRTPESYIDLANGTDGIYIAGPGWRPGLAGPEGENVIETIPLIFEGTSHDDLAVIQHKISTKLREISDYHEANIERYSIWLQAKLGDETKERHAFLVSGSLQVNDSIYAPPVSPGNLIQQARLILERTPYWESPTYTMPSCRDINCVGGTYSIGAITGNESARILATAFSSRSGMGGPLYEFWLGFRTERFGDPANFTPAWECEDGTLGTDASIDTTSEPSTASPGGGSGAYVTVNYSTTATIAPRVTIAVQDVTTNYKDQRGVYQVLLRAKVTSGTSNVRLLTGWSGSSDWDTQGRVLVNSTAWKCYPLGSISIPPQRGADYTARWLKTRAIRIESERATGSGNLLLDCAIMLPTAEHALYFSGADVEHSTDYKACTIDVSPDYRDIHGIQQDSSLQVQSSLVDIQAADYRMPVGESVYVIAVAQRENSQVITDTFDFFPAYKESWHFLRGNS